MAFDRSRRRVAKLAIILVSLAVLASAIWLYWILHTSDGELREKPVGAMLQGLAMDDGTNAQTGPLLHRENARVALGVPGRGLAMDDQGTGPASMRMWIVLNDHSASRTLRQSNRFAGYDLSCGYVQGLGALVPDLDDYVLAYLRTICR
jgi:hypothetical protein